MVIYKYELEVADVQIMPLPLDAKILCIQTQHNAPQIWVLGDPYQMPARDYRFYTFTTGNPIPDDMDIESLNYLGTYQMNNGSFVGHVFYQVMPFRSRLGKEKA